MSRFVVPILIYLFAGYTSLAQANEFLLQGDPNRPANSENSPRLKDQQQLIVKTPLSDGREAIISYTEVIDTTTAEAIELLQDQNLAESDIILSTDNETIAQRYIEDTEKPEGKRFLRIIPIGQLAAATQRVATSFNQFYTNASQTIRYDRIGLGVLSITVGMDCYIWINATEFDVFQKSSMIMFNLAMASTFGLDRELWGRLNNPIKDKLIKTFDRFIPTEKASVLKSLSSRYLSNMFLGTGIQLMRTGLLSLDSIQDAVMTTDFWAGAVKLSALVTLTSFAWSELYSSIDGEQNPKAKLLMKRLSDIRSIIMCNLATVSMVLQPNIYGNSPIISYVIHGAAGLAALALAHRIVHFLENNRLPNWAYKKMQTLERFINTGLSVINADVPRPQDARPAPPEVRETPQRRAQPRSAVTTNRQSTATPVVRSCRKLILDI